MFWNRKWRNTDFSARGHHRSNLMADSESQSMICYLCYINNFLSISYRLKVIRHFNFRWDFPVWGNILAVLGAGDPQNVNFSHFSPKRHVSQRNHVVWCMTHGRRKLRLTWRLVLEKKVRTKSQKFDKRPSRGGATARWTLKFFIRSNVLPAWSPLPNLFWSVDAFLFYRWGSKSRVSYT